MDYISFPIDIRNSLYFMEELHQRMSVTENGLSHINTYETETTKEENKMHQVFCS